MDSKNLFLLIISVCISLLIAEIGIRWLTIFPIHSIRENSIYDDKLSHRMDPSSLDDIDSNGFRNPRLFETVDIVALGDSHTFGSNVSSEKSWPQQLANITKMTTYNFGVGGYGSLQYHHLMDEAIKLKPKYIILGLYLANDLFNTCEMIRQMDYWDRWAIELGYDTQLCFNNNSTSLSQPNIFSLIKSSIKQTAIGSLTAYYFGGVSSRFTILNRKEHNLDSIDVVVNEKFNKTIIKHRRIFHHERYTDLNQGDIALSFEITKDIIKNAYIKAKLNSVNLSVVFIPSKECVYYDYLMENGYKLANDYHKLVDNEKSLVDRYSSFFKDIGIMSIDAKPYVKKELYKTGNVYPYRDDGHPLEIGYKAYAQAVYENIFKN